ncbi:MAG: PAS domain S-box protein [Halococcoides sp.]
MAWQSTWLVAALFGAGIVLYVLGLTMIVQVARNRMTVTVGSVLLFSIAGGTWGIASAYQLANTGAAKHLWFGIGTGAFVVLVVAWYVATVSIAGKREWLDRSRLGPVVIVGTVLASLSATSHWHGLLSTGEFVRWNDLIVIDLSLTPLYLGLLAFAGGLTLAGGLLIVRHAYRERHWIATTLVVATISIPVVTGTLYHLGAGPPINLTPIALVPPAVSIVHIVFTRNGLGRVPVPRSAVIDRMNEGLIVIDSNGRIDDTNPAARSMLGVGNVIGKCCADVWPEWPTPDPPATFETTVGEDAPRYLSVRVSELEDYGGQIVLITDVTEQRAIEQRYRAIIEESDEMNLLLDDEGQITYASPSVERIHGFDPEGIVGESAFEFVHPDDRERVREEFERIRSTPEGDARVENGVVDSEGNRRVSDSLVRNLLDHPHVGAVAVTSRDVTERKAREKRLEEMNQQLESFASVLSHDLRNPLEVASIHTELARRGDDEALETVESALDRMEAMIEDILTLVREDRTIDPAELDFETVLRDAWAQVHTGDATLVVEDSGRLVADRGRLHNVLENLIRNAITHGTPDDRETDPETATATDLTITAGRVDDGFFVADDGQGIDPEERSAVFDDGYTTDEDGTGLGLSIVERFADVHGWSVTVTESSDGGARFEFGGVDRPDSYQG